MILYALSYLRRGWSIIPVGADKRPVHVGDGYLSWRQFQGRRMSEAEARSWWDVPEPPGIGVVCGKISGLIVLDVEELGVRLRTFEGKLPTTLTAVSQSGGLHYYFRWRPERLRHVWSDGDQRLADVKADGGYVVAPPTRGEKGDYAWVERAELAELPTMFDAMPEVSQRKASAGHDAGTIPTATHPPLCVPGRADGPSRSERLMAIARRVISAGGSDSDVMAAWMSDESGLKIRGMTPESAERYLAGTCGKVRRTTPPPIVAPAKAHDGPVVPLRVLGLRWGSTPSGKRLGLILRDPDGRMVREGVTMIEGPRLTAFRAALPQPACGATVYAVVEEREWNGKKLLQVARWVPHDQGAQVRGGG